MIVIGINKAAWIKCGTRNKKYYGLKGYNGIKIGDIFEVKVEDLTKGSTALVNIECDGCGKLLENIKWQDYNKCVKEDGKYYCSKCANELYGHDNTVKMQLKNGITFKQWCYANLSKKQADEIMINWDEEKNGCKPDDVLHASEGINKRGYWFKCPRGIHPAEQKLINVFTKGKLGSLNCKTCNSFAQWGIDNLSENFLEKYWSDKNTFSPWDISYGSASVGIYIICQNHNLNHPDYLTKCNRFTLSNTSQSKGCPMCVLINKTGDKTPRWLGGTTTLNYYLRDKINEWKIDSMKQYNYKCVLSGGKFQVVHHLQGFDLIVKETLNELKLPVYNTLSQYTIDELQNIKDKCLELHYRYGLGVCLSEPLHNLFHTIFGRGNNTPEQFQEFQENHKNGLYDNIIPHSESVI